MKIFVRWLLIAVMLTGCNASNREMERILALRQSLLTANACSFTAKITADFGENTYSFAMSCIADSSGNVDFRVVSPESIAGISGHVRAGKGELSFDDSVLAFPLLADGELSPVSAPWLFWHTLLRGYIHAVSAEKDGLRATIFDSYESDSLQVDIWLNENNQPIFADLLWQGRNLMSIYIENFEKS